MKFTPLALPGVWRIDLDRREDARGFFARTFCAEEFARHGLLDSFVQCNISGNRQRGTVRGLHYQRPPHAEVKLIRCTRGALYDVVVDLRQGSPTFGEWLGHEIRADDGGGLYIPAGFAHGYQTLADDTEVFYQMGAAYEPSAVAGLRFDDPALGIVWPLPDPVVSERDRELPGLSEVEALLV